MRISRKVLKIDRETLEILKEYSSIKEASLDVGIGCSNICNCCKGNTKTAKGFIWRYKNPDELETKIIELDDSTIYRINIETKMVRKYKGIVECLKDNNIDNGLIFDCIEKYINNIDNYIFVDAIEFSNKGLIRMRLDNVDGGIV